MKRKWMVIVPLVLIFGGATYFYLSRPDVKPYVPPPVSFSGHSDSLKQTIVVSTLDTALEPNKSAVWCAAFQISWNQAKQTIFKEPIRVKGAEELCAALNASDGDFGLLPESYYAHAGFFKEN